MNSIKDVERLNQLELDQSKSVCFLAFSLIFSFRKDISLEGSWHWQYRKSNYVYVGGLSYDLTEGDLEIVMSQFGIITDLNLIRDVDSGESKGFGFVSYADWRSTVLAVDNMNGTEFMGRKLRVDHVLDYKPPDKEKGPNWWEQKQKAAKKKIKKEKKKKEKKKEKKRKSRHDEPASLGGGGLLVKEEHSNKKLVQMNDGSVFIAEK